MEKERNLWLEVGNKCLKHASELLDHEYLVAAETAATVKCLVDAAVQIDLLNLRWEERTQLYAAASRGQASSRQSKEN